VICCHFRVKKNGKRKQNFTRALGQPAILTTITNA